ncbi:MAG: crossover junction endodeoxyribonuclease RuvC [Armatimonadota bacterium]|nr:crossover junction endodeoxyribonuclease RuvC [Armatimonadota bacterium]
MPAPASLRPRAHPTITPPQRLVSLPLVLGIDPGLQRTGYGAVVLDGGRPRLREAGVLVTQGCGGLGARLHDLHRDVTRLLGDLRPDLIVLEDLFVHRAHPQTALALGHARGIIYLAAAAADLPILALAPSVVKQAVTGSGRASKTQVQAAVRALLGAGRLANPHAADALALAYAGCSRFGTRLGGLADRSVARRPKVAEG